VMDPPLSSIRVFKEEMGRIAVQRLVDMITAKTTTVVTTHVPVELVVSCFERPDRSGCGGRGAAQHSTVTEHISLSSRFLLSIYIMEVPK